MIKYATAFRTGTASTEAILRRFMKANATHPTYQAMIELGRAQKTIFLARYLRSRALQREIHEGLNVVESWNRANAVIFYGKGGDLATNRRDEQEMSVLCLRILQAALVYVNMLMLQDLLAEPEWADVLTAEDQRGLTPLFWSHVLPYGSLSTLRVLQIVYSLTRRIDRHGVSASPSGSGPCHPARGCSAASSPASSQDLGLNYPAAGVSPCLSDPRAERDPNTLISAQVVAIRSQPPEPPECCPRQPSHRLSGTRLPREAAVHHGGDRNEGRPSGPSTDARTGVPSV